MVVINSEQRQLLHQFLLLDLAVRSLQQDYKTIEHLKMKTVYLPLLDSLLKDLRKDSFSLKRQLASQQIRVVGWHRINEYFSDIQVATAGNDEWLRYANQALKTEVEQLLFSHIKKPLT
ncbi:aconitate hydratase [Lysinibacillus parviboronicapiens]|uniref:aconitate hydratase n=1 Tax=Lysinibacillus parviboronicapiens TaxID=436516 RepID=UPI001F34C920|nr:aconitate hydratase [Lysinibacillus parviboronicapiens]